ncbi:uncharacterized protein K452DRAFT_325140 [Aplosporella prunicola CBS 121167]|uniref:Trimethylguanosine synthase n=1 Tax=Aplosporella prunicola CBS 121167 TaxID=1176127 RepID=A0A6A6BKN9_9PEZI|nr:uncharacterized protein K452DRAFT_325140 [Aplosporella prunicola CBS 121167]KAF2144606.1 hypothetical protein K452DRAFT_325140 [Aplosporella prunicola CBS 121167]
MPADDPAEIGDVEPHVYRYESIEEVPKEIQKYWHQRYDIFSKYDEGVYLTHDAWFGITPESVAHSIAQHMATATPDGKTKLIDAFAGAGGNTIAFALSGRWEQIFAIEKDPEALACAKHNAEIYGVAKKIWWIEGDCLDVIPSRFGSMKDTVIFASPPWGGPGYRDDQIFNVETMQPYGLKQLYNAYSKVSKEVALYLPRTSNLNQLAKYVPDDQKIQVAHYCIDGASKALCAYYGNFGVIDNQNIPS